MEPTAKTKRKIQKSDFAGMLIIVGIAAIIGFGLVRNGSPQAEGLASGQQATVKTVSCTGSPAHRYQVTFTDQGVQPTGLSARLCDQVTITNNSGEEVIAAIGPHTHHIHYPGFEETALSHGQSYAFRLTQTGSLFLHDHDNEALHTTITVRQ